ncbi:Presenilin-like membrane protease, A22 family [Halopenitus malekzadehii]|uniref:Presenilin-like membrane protease, A22 family n=1 Tax=Halopenitus malekzadehii TaxID=1267564 RepID=A0A1H6HX47_9EURY|nr:presenilin family intramembrane aspartyl protease PSH [Halopenitus malekzadehii]SEH40532.1 Presenilin-like membrane protease, A22 family [Halopenitus malekzadehii]
MTPRELRGMAVAGLLFLLVQLGALVLVPEFVEQGYQPVENPQDPTNSLAYIAAILVATGLMLAAFRFDLDQLVRYVIVGSAGLLAWYVFAALVSPLLAIGLSAAVSIALLVHPEWYVIDTAGVLMGAGAAGLFGISFGILPALLLLSVLAVYDAISVYGTEHMLSLAEGVMDLRIPVILVIPLSLSYSLLADDFSGAADVHDDGDTVDETDADAEVDADIDRDADATDAGDTATDDDGRDAFFIGLGDAVIPAVLVASAATFSPAPSLNVPVLGLNLPALFAMGGVFLGLFVLLRWVLRGRAHAGLPLLNGGAIGGYVLGSIAAGVPLLEALGIAGLV